MGVLLALIEHIVEPVFSDSTLGKIILTLVRGFCYIITYKIITFKYKWTKKFKRLVENT